MAATLDEITSHILWNSTADGLAVVCSDGIIAAANGVFEKLFGFDPGEATGFQVDALVPTNSRDAHAQHRADFHDAPSIRSMGASRLLEGCRRNGQRFPVNVSLSPAEIDGEIFAVVAVRDLTERVAVEAQRSDAERRRSIAEDHDRIGRELHDTVIQHLFALGLRLQGLPALLDDDRSITIVNESVDTIDSVIGQIRSSIHGLRTTDVGQISLRERVVAVTQEMSELLPDNPSLQFLGDFDGYVDTAVASNLIPVLREALSNVGRHANATSLTVLLSVGSDVELEVRDDGTGIPNNVERSGLANMATRAHALGGSFTSETAERMGTVIRWSVPAEPRIEGVDET